MFRLNTDPAVLTPGRFYFAPESTPACPVPTLRASRNYVAEKGESRLEWGEVDGPQKWDNGAPPIFVPLPKLVGTEACLTGGGDDAEAAEPASDFFRVVCIGGRDYRFPTIVYTSFSIARHDSEFTYYNDVPLTIVDAMCEARYEGATDIPNVTAVLRVTDVPDGSLATNFYLVDRTPPAPPVLECCSGSFPYSFLRTLEIEGRATAGIVVWTETLVDLEWTWDGISYIAWHECGGDHWRFTLNFYQASGCRCRLAIENVDTWTLMYYREEGIVTCPPGDFFGLGEYTIPVGVTFTYCGHPSGIANGVYFIHLNFGPMP